MRSQNAPPAPPNTKVSSLTGMSRRQLSPKVRERLEIVGGAAILIFLICLSLWMTSCASVPLTPAPSPQPPALRPIAVNFTQPITKVHVWFDGAGITQPQDGTATMGRVGFPNFPALGVDPSNVHIRADGYQPYDCVTHVPDGSYDFFVGDGPELKWMGLGGYGQGWFVGANGSSCPRVLTPLVPPPPPLPPAPSRDEALNVCLSFQGLTVHTQQYGDLPWFESALTWLDLPADRQAVYAAKRAAKNLFCPGGDTHALIHVPVGDPLYDEPNQPYSSDRFGPRDWTNGMTKMDPKFTALVQEVRRAGFIPLVFACGDGAEPKNYACAMAETPLLLDALQHDGLRDLRQDVVFIPGYDGVFYGWGQNAEETRREIISWPTLIRASCPLCYIGIEHNTGHIPLGEGDGDWVDAGQMRIFDLLLSEFDDDRFDDSVWQIAARTIGPAYNRPAEQPAADDPGAPFGPNAGQFYLRQGTPRGRFYACAFEFGLYGQVHGDYDGNHVNTAQRPYFKNIGYSCGG